MQEESLLFVLRNSEFFSVALVKKITLVKSAFLPESVRSFGKLLHTKRR